MDFPIDIRDMTVTYRSRPADIVAVDHLTLTVAPGQVCGFLGPNGAGKTTTLHVLLGFIEPTSGEARIFGTDSRRSVARQRLGFLSEHPDTYRFLTGRELLSFTGRLFSMDAPRIRARVDEVLRLTGMESAAGRRVGTYSRGMMQRICLAQALVNDPDLVILDEPTSGLDPIGRMEVRSIISALRDRGKTVLFSSHELSEVELMCDHLAILVRGKVVASGKAADLVRPGQSLESYFMKVVAEARP